MPLLELLELELVQPQQQLSELEEELSEEELQQHELQQHGWQQQQLQPQLSVSSSSERKTGTLM